MLESFIDIRSANEHPQGRFAITFAFCSAGVVLVESLVDSTSRASFTAATDVLPVDGALYMDNPYESPLASTRRHIDGSGSTSSRTINHAAYACFVGVASVLCWMAFVFGVASSLKDMFGGPPPPESYVWLGLATLAGLVAETISIVYFIRRPSHAVKSSGSFLVIVLAMAGNILPISFSALSIVSDLIL